MNQVEVLDNGVVLNGNLLTFPLSYEDIRAGPMSRFSTS